MSVFFSSEVCAFVIGCVVCLLDTWVSVVGCVVCLLDTWASVVFFPVEVCVIQVAACWMVWIFPVSLLPVLRVCVAMIFPVKRASEESSPVVISPVRSVPVSWYS